MPGRHWEPRRVPGARRKVGAGINGCRGAGRSREALGCCRGRWRKVKGSERYPGVGGPPRHLGGGRWRWHLTLACGCRRCDLSRPAQRSSGLSRMPVRLLEVGGPPASSVGVQVCPGHTWLCSLPSCGGAGRWAGAVWTSSRGPRVLGAGVSPQASVPPPAAAPDKLVAGFAPRCGLRAVS